MALLDAENHRTQTEYDDARVQKVFLFRFINAFVSLAYVSLYISIFLFLSLSLSLCLVCVCPTLTLHYRPTHILSLSLSLSPFSTLLLLLLQVRGVCKAVRSAPLWPGAAVLHALGPAHVQGTEC